MNNHGIGALSPKSDAFLNFDVLRLFGDHYNANMEDLKMEMKQLSRLIERKISANEFHASSLIDMVAFIKRYEDAIFEIKRLLTIASTLPVTSAEAERTFSTLKTQLRATMSDTRLSSIAILSVHKKRGREINLERVVDEFVKLYPNCRIMLS